MFGSVYCLLGQRVGEGKYYQQISVTEEERDPPESGDLPKDMKESEIMMTLRLSMRTCNASIRLQLR